MTALETLAERAVNGEVVPEADARVILETHDLIAIGMMADTVRRRMHGNRTTFVRVFEIHVDAPPAFLPARVDAGEFRVIGRPNSIDAALAAVRAAAAVAGGAVVTGFSLSDLEMLAGGGQTLDGIGGRLREAGLSAVAEVPLDRLEEPESAVRALRRNGLEAVRLTVHELPEDRRLTIVVKARELQAAIGGFRAFAPLPQNAAVAMPTTGFDDVRQIALARVVAANIGCIQVDWAQYGPKLAQVALTTGADDVDNVGSIDPGILGHRRSPLEEIRGNIRAAGLEPVERDGSFARRGPE